MPLFEYECAPCKNAVEKAAERLMTGKKPSAAVVREVVQKTGAVNSAQVVNLKNGEVEAGAGKPSDGGQSVVRYSEDGSTMLLMNTAAFRFSELIYEEGDEKKVKCPACGSKKAEKVVSSFSFTSDLSTDMPKPDLSNLPPEVRGKVQLKGYIEEKDRPKKNR